MAAPLPCGRMLVMERLRGGAAHGPGGDTERHARGPGAGARERAQRLVWQRARRRDLPRRHACGCAPPQGANPSAPLWDMFTSCCWDIFKVELRVQGWDRCVIAACVCLIAVASVRWCTALPEAACWWPPSAHHWAHTVAVACR